MLWPFVLMLNAWLAADPYVTGGVWQRIAVQPFQVAVERAAAVPA